MAIPQTMSALILQAPNQLTYVKREVPQPGPGDILVKVLATTTCGTDLKAYLRGHPLIPMPGGLGHEYSGEVVAAGVGSKFTVGDQVMGVHSAPCQACASCLRGQENLCETVTSTMVLGTYAEYVLIPARVARLNVFIRPPELALENAVLLEPLSCVAQALSLIDVASSTRILIIGPGAIGLMFVAALRALGVEDVVLAGRNESRLALGEQFGARITKYAELDQHREGNFDYVIECTGTVEVWEKAPDYSRRGGTVILFGGCAGGTRASFDTRRIHYDQITLLSPFHFGTKAVLDARKWLIEGLDLSRLITSERSLDEAVAVFGDLAAGKGMKYVFKP